MKGNKSIDKVVILYPGQNTWRKRSLNETRHSERFFANFFTKFCTMKRQWALDFCPIESSDFLEISSPYRILGFTLVSNS